MNSDEKLGFAAPLLAAPGPGRGTQNASTSGKSSKVKEKYRKSVSF